MEDNAVNRRVAMLLLENIGYEVHAVESGFEALEALRSSAFDVVLLDVQMPEMDGFDTSRAIWRAIRSLISPSAIPLRRVKAGMSRLA